MVVGILSFLRVVAGGLFVLFLPGFAWTWVFYDGRQTSVLQRCVYSVALSIALISVAFFFCSSIGIPVNLFSSTVILAVITILPLAHILMKRKGLYARLLPGRWRGREQRDT